MKMRKSKSTSIVVAVLTTSICVVLTGASQFLPGPSDAPEELEFLRWLGQLYGVDLEKEGNEGESILFRHLAGANSEVLIVSSVYQCFSPEIDGEEYAKSPSEFMAQRITPSQRRWTIIQPAVCDNLVCSIEFYIRVPKEKAVTQEFVRVSVLAEKIDGKWILIDLSRTKLSTSGTSKLSGRGENKGRPVKKLERAAN